MKKERVVEALSLRASGLVRRWHTITNIAPQTVAEHSAQALSLLFLIHPDPSMALVKALLWHDASERWVGDVPSPARRADSALSDAYVAAEIKFTETNHPSACVELTTEEATWLRAIDVLELWLYCRDEAFLGNRHFDVIADRAESWLLDSEITPKEVREFIIVVRNEGYRSFA